MTTTCRITVVTIILASCIPMLHAFADTKTTKDKTPELRDPFWPIGFAPASEDDTVKQEIVIANPINWPKLKVQGISKSKKGYIALIQGRGMVKAGQILSIKSGRRIYKIRIDAITDKDIKTTNLETTPINNKSTANNNKKKTKGAR